MQVILNKGDYIMKAIILAAGRGSRMKDKTDVFPKCLTQLWGKSLLQWQIKALKAAGIEEIGIITGYHAKKITEPGLVYFHNDNWENTNMVATLLKAESWLEKEECIISYSDIIYTKTAIEKLMQNKNDISLVYYTKFLELWKDRFENPLDDIESFKVDETKKLIEIGNKVKNLNDIEGQYMGLLKFSPRGWNEIKNIISSSLPKPIEKIDMTTMLAYLIEVGIAIQAIPYSELWIEVDSPQDLLLYQKWDQEKNELVKLLHS